MQTGSRIRYRLQIAGVAEAVDEFREWLEGRLEPGQRIEGIRDARPEIRSALERAEKFLNIAALVSVLLAATAIALAARRFLQRHLDACAMMRCLGASQGQLMRPGAGNTYQSPAPRADPKDMASIFKGAFPHQ